MKASASRVSRDPYKPSVGRIDSWDDVARLVEHFSYYRNVAWLFRGVSNVEHGLTPLVGRADWRKPDPHGHGAARKRTHAVAHRRIPARRVPRRAASSQTVTAAGPDAPPSAPVIGAVTAASRGQPRACAR